MIQLTAAAIDPRFQVVLNRIMSDEFIFTEFEYSKMLGLSKEGVRSRRRSGKLEGEYKFINNQVFYKRARPSYDKPPLKNHTKTRRRGVMVSGQPYKYTRYALQKSNDYKALNRIKGTLNQEELGEINNELIKLAKEKVMQRKQEIKNQNSRHPTPVAPSKHYGGMLRGPQPRLTYKATHWTTIFPEPPDEYEKYLLENNLKNKPTKTYY